MPAKLFRILFTAALTLACIPSVNAFVSTLTLQGGTSLGLTDMDADRTLHGALGLSYEAWLNDNLALGVNPYLTSIEGDDNLNNYRANIWGADLYLKLRPVKFLALNFADKAVINRISPFIAAGVGIAHYASDGGVSTYDPVLDTDVSVPFSVSGYTPVLPFAAAGISLLTKWNVNLDLGVKLNYTTTDAIDNKVAGDFKDGLYTPYIGIGYNFGQPKAVTRPVIQTTGKFSRFTTVKGTPSAPQSYTLSGADLSGNIGISAPSGFEVSTNSGTTFVKTASLERDFNGPVLVRLTGAQSGEQSGSIVNTSPDATNISLPVAGSVSDFDPTTVILLDGSLDSFSTVKGTPSKAQTYNVSGNNLTSMINVSAPNGFEISSNNGATYGSTATLAPAINRVIWVRMTGAETGIYNGQIVHASSGALAVNQAVAGTVRATASAEDIFLPVVHFDTNYHVLREADKSLLDALAASLKRFPDIMLQVRGHTDSTGPDSINEPLGLSRAKVVRDYLVRQGIGASSLEVKGFSWRVPVSSNESVDGRSDNRRTDFQILK